MRGQELFVADLRWPGLCIGKPLLSPLARADELTVDVSKARRSKGVAAALTAADIPGGNALLLPGGAPPLLAETHIAYRGQAMALLLAESEDQLREGLTKVKVSARELPPVPAAAAALLEAAPPLAPAGNVLFDEIIRHGVADDASATPALFLDRTFHLAGRKSGLLEPCGMAAQWDRGRLLTVTGPMQSAVLVRQTVAGCLRLPLAKVKAVPMASGGAFGGKLEAAALTAAWAALLAWTAGRPAHILLSHDEQHLIGGEESPMTVRCKLALAADGALLAADLDLVIDAGAAIGWSRDVARAAAAHAMSIYQCPALTIRLRAVLSNQPPRPLFRGTGAVQISLALESVLSELSRSAGRSAVSLRLSNMLDVEGAAGKVLHAAVADAEQQAPTGAGNGGRAVGRGFALGAGGMAAADSSGQRPAARIALHTDGSVTVWTPVIELGQSSRSLVAGAVRSALNVPESSINIEYDEDEWAQAPAAAAQPSALAAAAAARRAAELVRQQLFAQVRDVFDAASQEIEWRDTYIGIKGAKNKQWSLVEFLEDSRHRGVAFAARWPRLGDLLASDAGSCPAIAAASADVTVDLAVGEPQLARLSVHVAVGQVLDQQTVINHISSAISEAVGWLLDPAPSAEMGSFCGVWPTLRADALPDLEIHLVDATEDQQPAAGISTAVITACAAAIAEALADAAGAGFTRLPPQPLDIWQALHQKHQAQQ